MLVNNQTRIAFRTFPDQTTNGVLGTSAELAFWSGYQIAQTTANINLSLPDPTPILGSRVRFIVANTGPAAFNINGVLVPSNREAHLFFDTAWRAQSAWVAATGITPGTLHNLTGAVPLTSANSSSEAHIEASGNYTINAADVNDGNWWTTVVTAASTTNTNLMPTGFTGAFLRNGNNTNISAGLALGILGDCFLIRVTENPVGSGNKFLNASRLTGNFATSQTFGSFDTATPELGAVYIQDRQGQRIESISFTLTDRRSGFPLRNTNVTATAENLAGRSGWTLDGVDTPGGRLGVSTVVTHPDASAYTLSVRWRITVGGMLMYFQDYHGGVWNTYARINNLVVNWRG